MLANLELLTPAKVSRATDKSVAVVVKKISPNTAKHVSTCACIRIAREPASIRGAHAKKKIAEGTHRRYTPVECLRSKKPLELRRDE